MPLARERYEEEIALAPWDYDGPEHVNQAPFVAIVDADGVVLDAEDSIGDLITMGRLCVPGERGRPSAPSSVVPTADCRARAVLVHPSPEAEDGIRVRALGYTEIAGDASCSRWLGQRPGCLLKFLLCRRYRPVHAEQIAQELWGHAGFVSSGTVRQCVYELRAKLDSGRPDSSAKLVVTRQGGYVLSDGVVVDADDFAVHVRRGTTALDRGQRAIATVHLRRAVSMYRGHFLSDEPHAGWAAPERERLREHMEDALGALAKLYLAVEDAPAATLCLRRLCEMRPFDPDAHRRLLTVLLAQGRYSHAKRCYQALCVRLRRDLSTSPGFTLCQLLR